MDRVIKIFRRALSQDIRITDSKQIFRMEDCYSLYANSKYVSLKDRATDAESFADLADSELKEHEKEICVLRNENAGYKAEIDNLYQINSDLEDDLRKLEYEKKTSLEFQCDLVTENQSLRRTRDDFGTIMEAYPDSVPRVVQCFVSMYSDKIDFTSRGWKSLDACNVKLPLLWSCLYHMATTLHRLYTEGCLEIEKEYKRLTGWDLARGEGSQTRRDKQLMALREDHYDGKKIFIEPHIKKGRNEGSSDFIRVYYTYDKESRKILVGHCGSHLENYTSLKV